MWEAWLGKVLTLDQLKRRRFSLVNRCYLCGEAEENIDYLLIHCLKIRTLWSSLLTALDIAWVTPLMTKDVIISWNKILLRKDDHKISRATFCCLFWAIWKEINKVVFEDEQFSLSKLKKKICIFLVFLGKIGHL